MVDIFASEGIAPPRDIFATEGIAPPSLADRNSSGLSGIPLDQAPEDVRAAEASNSDQMMQLARSRYSDQEIDAIRAKGKIGFWEAQDFISAQDVIPGGGFFQAKDLYDVYGAAKKIEAGEPLDDDEKEKFNSYIDKQIEMNLRGMSVMGGISYYGSQVPAFAIEFALSGGAGKAAQEAVETAAKKVVTQQISSKAAAGAVKAATKTAAVSANVAARTVMMPQRYIPKYAELRLNDFMAITDKGELVFTESKDSPATSALKAFAYTGIDVASEMSGAALGKYIVKPVTGTAGRYLKTPIASGLQQLPVGVRQNLYKAYQKIQPNARVSEIMTRAGWNGMLEELGEERVADVMKASFDLATDKDYTAKDYMDAITPSADQILVEAGIIGIMGGAKASADIAANILAEKLGDRAAAREAADNMSATEQEAFVEAELKKKGLQTFIDMAKDSESAEAFFEAARGIGGVPSEVSAFFGERYNKNGNTMEDGARLFYDDVKAGRYDEPADPVSKAQMSAARQQNPVNINAEESGFDKFYREFVNSLQPIEDLTKEAEAKGATIAAGRNPFVLSRTYAGMIGQVEHNLKYGTTRLNPETGQFEITGKAMKSILDDLDNSVSHIEGSRDQRETDFNDYLIARRTLEDLIPRNDVEVTEADKVKAIKTMNDLAVKYGDEFAWFKTFAEEMYDFQRRILSNLVDAGVMSKDMYDGILQKNPNYIPFQRVLEDKHFAGAVSARGGFTDAKSSKVIKKIKGSDKEIKTPTHQVIANTAKIIDLAYRNRVATGVADLADLMPEYIEKTKPIVVKRGTTKTQVTYDAGLRRKLEAAIDYFGNTMSRQSSVKGGGMFGYVRGSYSPMEKMVRARLGTNEGTLAHEVGHMLDYELGLMEKLLDNPKVKKELQELGRRRLAMDSVMTDKGERVVFEDRVLDVEPKKYKDYVTSDREVIANLFDAYVNAPDLLKQIAPTAKKAFEKLLDEKPELAFIKEIKPTVERAEETIEKDVWSPLDIAPQDTITVYRDGKKEFYKVSPPLLEAMKNLSPVQMNATFRLLTEPFRFSARVLRAGATLIPEFWIRNVIRDQGTALLQSPLRPTPVDMVKGLTAVIGKNELYQDWMRNGGAFNSYMELDDRGLEKAYKELFKPDGRFMRYLKNPIKVLADISQALEQGTRLGVYAKARENGIVGIEAALLAREATLDFGRGGVVSRNINQYVPFFNAGVQSVDKLARTFKENPKATAFWGIATITVPSILLTGYYLYGAPEDERREYLEIPQWQKDMFWVFKVGDQWQRIPKPFSFGYLFGSVPERFMTWAYQGDKPEVREFWKELALGVTGTISPVYDPSALLPPLVKVAIEDLTNYNFFTGREIYPAWMENYEPEQRKNKYTSEAATELGERLGVSPALLDNSLRGQLAGSADYITDAADSIIRQVKEWNGAEVPEKPQTQADTPVIRAFAVREPTGYHANSVSNFFDDWEKVSQVNATFNKLEGEEKIEYRDKNAAALAAYKPMKKYYDRIAAAGKAADRIYNDSDMPGDEKVEALSDNGAIILDTAIQANSWYKENVKGE